MSYGKHYFRGVDYATSDDFAEVYWDPTAVGKGQPPVPVVGNGKYRYLNGGKRWLAGEFPKSEPKMFDAADTETWYTEDPPADIPPSYPCRECPSTLASS